MTKDERTQELQISHLGRTVSLSSDNGEGGQNYTRSVFDDEAVGPVTRPARPSPARSSQSRRSTLRQHGAGRDLDAVKRRSAKTLVSGRPVTK
jgi:hypothetical protein